MIDGYQIRELSVPEWTALEEIRLDTSRPESVCQTAWLAKLMSLSVVDAKGSPKWPTPDDVTVRELAKHGEAVAEAALEANGFGEKSAGEG